MSEVKRKSIFGYCMYDWGKSAFETSVTTAILPAWVTYLFLEANGLTANLVGAEMSSDAVWAYSVAIATVLVAILSPSFGVIADRGGVYWRYPLALVGWSAAGFATGLAENYQHFMLCRIALGFFEAGHWP